MTADKEKEKVFYRQVCLVYDRDPEAEPIVTWLPENLAKVGKKIAPKYEDRPLKGSENWRVSRVFSYRMEEAYAKEFEKL